MSINCTNREALDDFLRTNLKESRYRHSQGVEEMAVRLARLHGADEEKAAFAGRYHDIAKNFDTETMDSYVRKYGLPEKLIGNNALAHSKVGAEILEHEFGVSDREILDAVRYHTTACKDMTILEELIFVADVVEDNRTYSDLEYYQNLAYTDLDKACLEILEYTIGSLTTRGMVIDIDTLEARDWVLNKIKEIENGK
ncbi:MAG: bis(5'-nucleosyl)-tetraphosphatase (symmetrical) YqeK [Mogibacterium sp.]|nr:bis(5'-nucleosyl)-tetraphosphatase (symmetrical) YqeK [Mogibacterium sp.]